MITHVKFCMFLRGIMAKTSVYKSTSLINIYILLIFIDLFNCIRRRCFAGLVVGWTFILLDSVGLFFFVIRRFNVAIYCLVRSCRHCIGIGKRITNGLS